jgi:hypothetical protein
VQCRTNIQKNLELMIHLCKKNNIIIALEKRTENMQQVIEQINENDMNKITTSFFESAEGDHRVNKITLPFFFFYHKENELIAIRKKIRDFLF